MNKNITTLKDTYGTAYENYKKGNLKTAEILCYKILSIDANHVDSISLLATISAIKKDFFKAKQILKKDKLYNNYFEKIQK